MRKSPYRLLIECLSILAHLNSKGLPLPRKVERTIEVLHTRLTSEKGD